MRLFLEDERGKRTVMVRGPRRAPQRGGRRRGGAAARAAGRAPPPPAAPTSARPAPTTALNHRRRLCRHTQLVVEPTTVLAVKQHAERHLGA
jgi:hypothetical protein